MENREKKERKLKYSTEFIYKMLRYYSKAGDDAFDKGDYELCYSIRNAENDFLNELLNNRNE